LASNFSDEPVAGPADEVTPVAPVESPESAPAAVPSLSPAVERFRSCRWRRPPEDGIECCTHRDVLPMAGSNGFNPDAWCPECEHFKAKRAPRKRQEREEYW
jgi:hypothetical protein